MFKKELLQFINAVKRNDTSINSLQAGVDTLSIALQIREIINE